MKKYNLAILVLIYLFTISTNKASTNANNGVLFKFNQKHGDVFKIKGYTKVNFYRNNRLRVRASSRWQSKQKAISKTKRGLKFRYLYMSKKSGGKTSSGEGIFIRDKTGKMYVNPRAFYPQSKSTPTFPKNRVKKLGLWKAKGHEIIDFRNLGFKTPLKLEFNARYRYLKDKTVNGKKHAVIQCFYIVNKNLKNKIYVPGYSRYRPRRLMPARLIGKYERIFYWDIEKGYWTKMIAHINFILSFTNAIHVEWKSKVNAEQKKIN